MTRVKTLADLQPFLGQELGVGAWVVVTQAMINQFAETTGDKHWVHTDPERAKSEGGFGGALAHGFLTLSLLTGMLKECMEVEDAKRWMNYGLDNVRFTSPVMAGQRVRLRLVLGEFDMSKPGVAKLRCDCTMELEGSERPALVCGFRMIGYE